MVANNSNLKQAARTSLGNQAGNATKPFDQTGVENLDIDAIGKIVLSNQLKDLTANQRVELVKHICSLLGLSYITQPICIIEFQSKSDKQNNVPGKVSMYATKDCAEQLRKIHSVSIDVCDIKLIDDLCIATVRGQDKTGRKDSSTGVTTTYDYGGKPLTGELKANAVMKAETKAKRRFTLSICGLGFLMDESEIEGARAAYEAETGAPTEAITQPAQQAPAAPLQAPDGQENAEQPVELSEEIRQAIKDVKDRPALTKLYNDNPALQADKLFVDLLNKRREELPKKTGLLTS